MTREASPAACGSACQEFLATSLQDGHEAAQLQRQQRTHMRRGGALWRLPRGKRWLGVTKMPESDVSPRRRRAARHPSVKRSLPQRCWHQEG